MSLLLVENIFKTITTVHILILRAFKTNKDNVKRFHQINEILINLIGLIPFFIPIINLRGNQYPNDH